MTKENMKAVSVVVNARLDSTRVPAKLVRPFAGTTLLEIALTKLNEMDYFENRYLATAEDKIKEFVNPYPNVSILDRDAASVVKGVHSQIVTFAHYLKIPTDYIFVFNPCLPFISLQTIRNAYDYFQTTDYPSYTASVPTRDWIFDGEGHSLTNKDPHIASSMAGEIFHKGAHAFHIISKKRFEENKYHWNYTPGDPHLIEIPEQEHIDIDYPIDFEFAEFCYLKKSGKL